MDRRKFIKTTGWTMLGVAASGSLLGSCTPGSKEAKKIMPSPSGMKMFWGDLHNHCNLTYGHGDMRDAFEAAKGQLDFVSVTPHAMWPDIPGADDPRLNWVIDYHTQAFKRLRKGGYEKYQAMTKEYNKEGEFLTFIGYEAHSKTGKRNSKVRRYLSLHTIWATRQVTEVITGSASAKETRLRSWKCFHVMDSPREIWVT